MKFILSRTDDYKNHSKKWVIGYALLFWVITRMLAGALVAGCGAIYEYLGFSAEELAQFSSSPDQFANSTRPVWFILMMTLMFAPLLEECVFRLGLSFKKGQVAISMAMIPVLMVWMYPSIPLVAKIVLGVTAISIFFVILRFTTQNFWTIQKKKWLLPAIWISTAIFGLLHIVAFQGGSLVMLPYMLSMCLVIFFAGCSIAYLRVNLGFGYGLGMHIFNNLPIIAFLLV